MRDLGLQSQDDRHVWAYAAAHGYTIVSKDDDFHHLSFLFGAPPKVIGIQLGNSSTADIERLLRAQHGALLRFAAEPSTAFIALP